VSQRQLHLATGKPSIVAATIDDWGKHWSGSMIATKGDFKRDRSIRSFSLNADAAASAAVENVSSLSGDELNTVRSRSHHKSTWSSTLDLVLTTNAFIDE
jgi:hypothetical protein